MCVECMALGTYTGRFCCRFLAPLNFRIKKAPHPVGHHMTCSVFMDTIRCIPAGLTWVSVIEVRFVAVVDCMPGTQTDLESCYVL